MSKSKKQEPVAEAPPAEATAPPAKPETALWVCAGVRKGQDVPLVWVFYPLGAVGYKDEPRIYDKKKITAFCGGVFRVTTTNGGKTLLLGNDAPQYIKRYHDKGSIVEWEALEHAAKAELAAAALFKKDAQLSEFEKCLEPVAKAMRATNYVQRQAIKVWILDYLDRYR